MTQKEHVTINGFHFKRQESDNSWVFREVNPTFSRDVVMNIRILARWCNFVLWFNYHNKLVPDQLVATNEYLFNPGNSSKEKVIRNFEEALRKLKRQGIDISKKMNPWEDIGSSEKSLVIGHITVRHKSGNFKFTSSKGRTVDASFDLWCELAVRLFSDPIMGIYQVPQLPVHDLDCWDIDGVRIPDPVILNREEPSLLLEEESAQPIPVTSSFNTEEINSLIETLRKSENEYQEGVLALLQELEELRERNKALEIELAKARSSPLGIAPDQEEITLHLGLLEKRQQRLQSWANELKAREQNLSPPATP
ncbi:MAG TPA: hypothetical protein PKA63_03320 [Oligoflexia bacterium]|nr:hypothetical protein [Oligoflexia bacterium]HMP47685.1 hypothetical protein [Oligoflexia bacterium]